MKREAAKVKPTDNEFAFLFTPMSSVVGQGATAVKGVATDAIGALANV